MGARTVLRTLSAAVLATLPLQAYASDAMSAADICFGGKVSRERLALVALAKASVSPYPLAWAGDHPGALATLTPAWRVLADPNYCTGSLTRDDGTPQCDKGDRTKIEKARAYVMLLFSENSTFSPAPDVTAVSYFTTPGAQITCPSGTPVKDPWIKGPDFTGVFPLRVRGSTDGLQFDRNVDAEQFAGLDRATISWSDDRTKDTSAFKLTLVAGLSMPIPGTKGNAQLIPYIGYKINKSKTLPDPRKATDEVLRGGAVFAFFTRDKNWTNSFTFRMEYAANKVEDSEILSENIGWVPEFRYLNEFAWTARDRNGDPLISLMPRGDIRMNFGRFLKQGTRSDDESHNFWRLGFQYGGTIKSDLAWLPIDVTVLNTRLYALKGYPGSLAQLKATVSANFGKDKLFGADLSYTRGRIEDLVKREDGWSIGFGAKF